MIRTTMAALAAVMVASCGGGAPAASQAAPVAMGTPVTMGGAEVTITDVSTPRRVGVPYAYAKAAEGGKLVVVSYGLKNAGDKPLEFYEQPKLHLVDPAGTKYSEDSGHQSAVQMEGGGDGKMFADLNPGITTRSKAVFEVAADKFDPATWMVQVGDDGQRVKLK